MTRIHRAGRLPVAPLLLLVAGSGCGSRPPSSEKVCAGALAAEAGSDPDASFAKAESLRLAYEKKASERAIPLYCGASSGWIRRSDSARAARAMQRLGETYLQLGLLEKARDAYQEALSLGKQSGDGLLESDVGSDLGYTRAVLGTDEADLGEASDQCHRALALAREGNGAREEAKALNCSGEIEYHRGDLVKALDLYRSAGSLWEGTGDPRGRAETLFFEGSTLSDLNRFAEAREVYERSLPLWASAGDERGEALTRISLARLKHRQGKYQEALNDYRDGLETLERIGDSIWEASGTAGIGAVYFEMGDAARAARYWDAALDRYRAAGLRTAVLDLLVSLGDAHLQLGEPGPGLERFREALRLAEEIGSDRWQAFSLRNMARATGLLGEPKQSLSYLQRALVCQESVGDSKLEASILSEMGEAHHQMGDFERAREYFGRALELDRASGARLHESMTSFRLARAALAEGDVPAAGEHVERALDVAESLRAEVASRELRTSYFASIYRYHELRIDVLMRLQRKQPKDGFAAEAFEASERARARSLLDSLAEAEVDLRSGIDPDLLARERTAKGALESAETSEASAKEVEDLEARYDLILAEIRSRSPRYAAVTQPQPLGLEEVQAGLLDDETVLLEYALGEERSYVWAVSRTGFTSRELPPRVEIERAAELVYELLTARARVGGESLQERSRRIAEADARYPEAAGRLSETLLGPLAGAIAGRRLVVVADGTLQYVPFAALPIPRRGGEPIPLAVEHEVVSLPSASSLTAVREQVRGRRPTRGSVAIFADPVFGRDDSRMRASAPSSEPAIEQDVIQVLRDVGIVRGSERNLPRLAATRAEAEAILAAVPMGSALPAIGLEANRAKAMDPALKNYRVVHFATHGIFNTETPALSGLILSMVDAKGAPQDGFLRLHDIYNMDLPVDLVVLSACNTALGRRVRGEGLVGIVRAFMYAGAERVVASLWKVDDEATSELMRHFYQGMFASGLPPSEALRRAQVAMWRQEGSRFPFYWGAFVLQGEWRS
jgi:CHAT domain-containing protein/tetratricopeptide (TPR) repeat protein